MTAGHVAVRELRAGYGESTILDIDHLDVQPGEFLSVLGPSGCGKTTLLNVVAGFVEAREGHVIVDGCDVTTEPPHRRNLGLVFQSYALFPHLTVAQNVAYGLKVRKTPSAKARQRTAEVLELVDLDAFAERRPRELSGGQQQRVALARALAYSPNVLLLDEPLSNLDAKLRRLMQFELRQIQRRVGTTMIFVTHDQDEALTMSDRVALLNRGKIEQLGTPEEIYRSPRTPFVADFLGSSNLVEASLRRGSAVTSKGTTLPVQTNDREGEAVVVLRREHIRLEDPSQGHGEYPLGVVTLRAFSGGTWHVHVRMLPDGTSTATADIATDGQPIGIELADAGADRTPPREGEIVRLVWEPSAAVVIDQ